jgi:hypothetical protein
MVRPALTNWAQATYLVKQTDHRLVSHLPGGQLAWRMPSSSEEINWGTSPGHPFLASHDIWDVAVVDGEVLAVAQGRPYLVVRPYGKGWFIYCAALQPIIGHGGFAPGMYTYLIFRRAVEWAFEAQRLPVPKLSPWPYQYDAAFLVRHDLENFTNLIANIEASALAEFTNGARGDYYFCTGTVREDATNQTQIIEGLQRAMTNYGATIGPHNGGLKNPVNLSLTPAKYDYWHWGPDEALDVTPTNYTSGKEYALVSLSNSFVDVETWLPGLMTNGMRVWVSCYFNATREDSYEIQDQLGVKVTGEQKLTPFPHWTVSTRTSGKLYSLLTQPTSDWFIGGLVGQSLDPWNPPGVFNVVNVREAIDFYYDLGALINIYSHSLSTGQGDGGAVAREYLLYGMNTNVHPRMWGANAISVYEWWVQRSNATLSTIISTNGGRTVATMAVTGATHADTAVELALTGAGQSDELLVRTNGLEASAADYRLVGSTIRVRTGTTVTNVEISFVARPLARPDYYTLRQGEELSTPADGLLANDASGQAFGQLTALLATNTPDGLLQLTNNGGFSFQPASNFFGTTFFSYLVSDGFTNSDPAPVHVFVQPKDTDFYEDFIRAPGLKPRWPWLVQSGNWVLTNGAIQNGLNGLNTYSFAYVTNRWSNYSVEARIRFGTNSYGGGLGGRLDPATGRQYAAWIYPEGSTGYPKTLRLVKFNSWGIFGYQNVNGQAMAQVPLEFVGTNWHALRLSFHGNQISVDIDGSRVLSMTDNDLPTYSGGSPVIQMWTSSQNSAMAVDTLSVRPLLIDDSYTAFEDTPLSVPEPGVLSNDLTVFTNAIVLVQTPPANGALSLETNGGFTYLPSTNFNGSDSFTYRVVAGSNEVGIATVAIGVVATNDAPILPVLADYTLPENGMLLVTNTAADPDLPANTVSYALLDPPEGASIDGQGVIRWSPTEAQGPGTNVFETLATDDGVPPMSATNSFTVIVTEVNAPPVLPIQTTQTVVGMQTLVITNSASDPDVPANLLTYTLLAAPTNAVIDALGIITWTPAANDVPGTYIIETAVSDDGVPSLGSTNSFQVNVVSEAASDAPVLKSLEIVEQTARITWESIAGVTYRVQFLDSLSETNWIDLTPDILAASGVTTYTNFNLNPEQRYYRVMRLP